MQSMWFVKPGQLEWRDVPEPQLQGDQEALVTPVAAATCDIDRLVIEGRPPFGAPPFAQAFPLGHEAVARVVAVGDGVREVVPGDVVTVAWRPYCGNCRSCRRGLTAYCECHAPGTGYGIPTGEPWGGLFDDLVRVPWADAMLHPVPPQVDPETLVSAADNLSLGRAMVRHHLEAGRRRVLVLGWGATALHCAAYALAAGAERVVYLDPDPSHRRLAASLGATVWEAMPGRTPERFDLVVDGGFEPDWLRRAVYVLEPEGAIECIAHFTDVTLPGHALYATGVHFHCSICSNGPHVAAAIEAVASGRVNPGQWWTQRVDWDQAPAALAEPGLKTVAVRPAAQSDAPWR